MGQDIFYKPTGKKETEKRDSTNLVTHQLASSHTITFYYELQAVKLPLTAVWEVFAGSLFVQCLDCKNDFITKIPRHCYPSL